MLISRIGKSSIKLKITLSTEIGYKTTYNFRITALIKGLLINLLTLIILLIFDYNQSIIFSLGLAFQLLTGLNGNELCIEHWHFGTYLTLTKL